MSNRALALVVLLAACQKAGSRAAPEPEDLLLTVSVASPRAALARAAAYLEAVAPGSGAALEPSAILQGLRLAVAAPGLDGLDLDQPLYLLLLDPRKFPRPVVLSAAVADQAKVEQTTGAGADGNGRPTRCPDLRIRLTAES